MHPFHSHIGACARESTGLSEATAVGAKLGVMSYVVVEDVAASWVQYQRFANALAGPAPAGLIVHAAGPTDEGFRIVSVWESEEAWQRFADVLGSYQSSPEPPQALRALRPEHVIYGAHEQAEERA